MAGGNMDRTCMTRLIRVPLVIKGPTLTPGVIHTQVQLIDIFPTLP